MALVSERWAHRPLRSSPVAGGHVGVWPHEPRLLGQRGDVRRRGHERAPRWRCRRHRRGARQHPWRQAQRWSRRHRQRRPRRGSRTLSGWRSALRKCLHRARHRSLALRGLLPRMRREPDLRARDLRLRRAGTGRLWRRVRLRRNRSTTLRGVRTGLYRGTSLPGWHLRLSARYHVL